LGDGDIFAADCAEVVCACWLSAVVGSRIAIVLAYRWKAHERRIRRQAHAQAICEALKCNAQGMSGRVASISTESHFWIRGMSELVKHVLRAPKINGKSSSIGEFDDAIEFGVCRRMITLGRKSLGKRFDGSFERKGDGWFVDAQMLFFGSR